MNWTGGGLQRHSKAAGQKSTITNKQKQHFARARTRFQDGSNPPSPFHPVFLQEAPSVSKRRYEAGRQRTLAEFETTAPLVGRLSSMTPRLPQPLRSLKQQEHNARHKSVARNVERLLPPVSHTINRPSSTRSMSDGIKHEGKVSARQHWKSSLLHNRRNEFHADRFPEDLTLEEARRKLLVKHDWVGLGLSRPLQMNLASSKANEHVGKRRKISPKDQVLRRAAYGRVRVPSVQEDYMMSGALQTRAPPVDESIRIRIGDDALLSQVSTRQLYQEAGTVTSREPSSESMMLEDEQRLRHEGSLDRIENVDDEPLQEPQKMESSSEDVPSPLARTKRCLKVLIMKDSLPYQSRASARPDRLDKRVDTSHLNVAKSGLHSTSSVFDSRNSEAPLLGFPTSENIESLLEELGSQRATVGSVRTIIVKPHVMPVTINKEGKDEDILWRQFMDIPAESTTRRTFTAQTHLSFSTSPEYAETPGEAEKNLLFAGSSDHLMDEQAAIKGDDIPSNGRAPSSSTSSEARSEHTDSEREIEHGKTIGEITSATPTHQPTVPRAPEQRISTDANEGPIPAQTPTVKAANESWRAFVFGCLTSSSASDREEHDSNNRYCTSATRSSIAARASTSPSNPFVTAKAANSSILSISHGSSEWDSRTNAATVAPSSTKSSKEDSLEHELLASRPRTIDRTDRGKLPHDHQAKETSPSSSIPTDFSRPSSVANASTVPAVLRTNTLNIRPPSPLRPAHAQVSSSTPNPSFNPISNPVTIILNPTARIHRDGHHRRPHDPFIRTQTQRQRQKHKIVFHRPAPFVAGETDGSGREDGGVEYIGRRKVDHGRRGREEDGDEIVEEA